MFAILEQTGATELHVHRDPVTGLPAITAISPPLPGPAIGGCRHRQQGDRNATPENIIRLNRSLSDQTA